MADIDNLVARRTAVLAEIAALDSTKAGGLPDVQGGGVAIQHQAYKNGLYEELERLNAMITAFEGPWEVVSKGVT